MIATAPSGLRLPGDKLSFSSARSFSQCRNCWYRDRILHEPGKRVGIALPIGSAVHGAMQFARKSLMAGATPTFKASKEAARESWESTLADLEAFESRLNYGSTGYKTADAAFKDVEWWTERAVGVLLPQEAELGIVEVECRPDFGGVLGFTFDGYVDVILNSPNGGLLLKDLKTSRDARAIDVWAKMQLRLYAFGWLFKGQDVDLQVDQLVKNQLATINYEVVESDRDKVADAVRWFRNVARDISDVATRDEPPPANPGWWCSYDHGQD